MLKRNMDNLTPYGIANKETTAGSILYLKEHISVMTTDYSLN
jgi:hypothetical protein